MEVEAIGHVRHKNLVRLLGYCIEGTHRYPTCQIHFGLSKCNLNNLLSGIELLLLLASIMNIIKIPT